MLVFYEGACPQYHKAKFGYDLYLPLDAKLKIKIGDVLTGFQTVIAEF